MEAQEFSRGGLNIRCALVTGNVGATKLPRSPDAETAHVRKLAVKAKAEAAMQQP
jgi:hypothetical protein